MLKVAAAKNKLAAGLKIAVSPDASPELSSQEAWNVSA